jgi:hypothetical protein
MYKNKRKNQESVACFSRIPRFLTNKGALRETPIGEKGRWNRGNRPDFGMIGGIRQQMPNTPSLQNMKLPRSRPGEDCTLENTPAAVTIPF